MGRGQSSPTTFYLERIRTHAPLNSQEQLLQYGNIDDVKEIREKDLTNRVFRGKIGDVPVIIKPESGLAPGKIRLQIKPGLELYRERAAYLVAPEMGLKCPTLVIRFYNGERCSVQEDVQGQCGSYLADMRTEERAKLLREIALFDVVVGNTDRHYRNLRSADIIYPIDHGLCLPDNKGWSRLDGVSEGNYEALDANKGFFLSDKEIKKLQLLADNEELYASILSLGVGRQAIQRMKDRIAALLEKQRFPEYPCRFIMSRNPSTI